MTLHEIWCDVPVEVARARCHARLASRHPIHGDDPTSLADKWRAWSVTAEPLGIGPVYRVDTSRRRSGRNRRAGGANSVELGHRPA